LIGDYDGDKGLVIFQPEVVEAFKEASLDYLDLEKYSVDEYFKHEKDDVAGFLAQVATLDDAAKIYKLQEYLLGAVRDTSVVGKYSNFHGAATYILGYTHRETIRLAYMYGICRQLSFFFFNSCYIRFCTSLDGLKKGMAVKEEVLKEDSRKFQKRSPEWKETKEEWGQFFASCRNESHLQRPTDLGRFIMDELYEQAKGEEVFWLAKIETCFESKAHNRRNAIDEDLVAPWDQAIKKSRRYITEQKSDVMERELEEIAKHVRSVYKDHRLLFSSKRSSG
jgi:RNA-dependent RNA polymerase